MFKPPDPLKWSYEWKNIISMIASACGGLFYFWVGSELLGYFLGIIIGVLVFVSSAAIAYSQSENGLLDKIRLFFEEKSKSAEAKELAEDVKTLQKQLARGRLFMLALTLLLIVCMGLLAWPLAKVKFYSKEPGSLTFKDARYYLPSREEEFLDQTPFLLAVVTALKDEGLAEGKKFRIVLGTSDPMMHPTVPVRFSLVVLEGKFSLSGFAFRLSDMDGRRSYEPLPIDYSHISPSSFTLPASKEGDRVFFVGRLTSESPTEFPDNVAGLMTLKPLVEPKK